MQILKKDVANQQIVMYATNVSDHFSPRPDMDTYTTAYISKNGSSLQAISGLRSWANIGAGFYAITPIAEDLDTEGPLILYIYGKDHPLYCDPIRIRCQVVANSSDNVIVGGYAEGFDPASMILSDSTNKLFTDSSGKVMTTEGGVVTLAPGSITAESFDGTSAYPQIVENPASLILADTSNLLQTTTSGEVYLSGFDTAVDVLNKFQFDSSNRVAAQFEGVVPTAQEVADTIMLTAVDGTVDVGNTLKRLLAIGSGKISVENGNIYSFYGVDSTEIVFSVIINQFTRTPL